MSLQTFFAIAEGPEWSKTPLEDQTDILSGAFTEEISAAKDDAEKSRLYKDFSDSRTVLAANKVKDRLGDRAPMATKAYQELIETEAAMKRTDRPAAAGDDPLDNLDPAVAIRQIEAVEALTGHKLGGEELRKDFLKLGPSGVSRQRLFETMGSPGYQDSLTAARSDNRDLDAFFNFASSTDDTEFKPWLKDDKNPDGMVQIRKKPMPGPEYEVKFPNGSVESYRFGKETGYIRPLTGGEEAVMLTGIVGTLFMQRIGDLFVDPYAKPGERTPEQQAQLRQFQGPRSETETREDPFGPLDVASPSSGQLLRFITQHSDKLTPDQQKDFGEIYGRFDVGALRSNFLSAPIRGVFAQSAEGIAGTVGLARRAVGGGEDSMVADFSRGGREAARLIRRDLAPEKADAGAAGKALFTIMESGSGLVADILVARGAGRLAKVGGLTEAGIKQVSKAGFALSSSIKVVGRTYNDAFAAHRSRGLSFEESHRRASTEAETVGLFTALIERAGPAEFFLSPKQAKTVADVVRTGLKGALVEGLGEEVPQAFVEVAMRDLFRDDGSVTKEITNLRQALGSGNLEAFKNSDILQGFVGGTGAGAAVGSVQAAADRSSGNVTPPLPTADLTTDELRKVANQAMVLPERDGSAGEERRKALETVPEVIPPPPVAKIPATVQPEIPVEVPAKPAEAVQPEIPVEPDKGIPVSEDTPITKAKDTMLAAVGKPRDGFADQVETEQGARLELKPDGDAVLAAVTVPKEKRGAGAATEAMTKLIEASKETGVPVKLEVEPFGNDAEMTKPQLRDWYSRLGFKPTDDTGNTMIFDPKAEAAIEGQDASSEPVTPVPTASPEPKPQTPPQDEKEKRQRKRQQRQVLKPEPEPAPTVEPKAPVEEQAKVEEELPAPKPKRPLEAKDLIVAERLADTATKGENNQAREAALNAVTDQLIKDPDTPIALLTTIAKRAAGTRGVLTAEREARAAGDVGTLDSALQETEADTGTLRPDQAAMVNEETQRIQKVIGTFSKIEQAALRGAAEGKTNEQIAKELKTTPSTVANAKTRGRAKLRKALGQKTDAEVPLHKPTAPEKTKKESNKTDQQLVDELIPALAKSTGRTVAEVANSLRPSLKPVSKSQKAAQGIANFFGRRVVFISGVRANGMFHPGMPSVIFISDTSSRSEVLVVFHELLHSLAATDPAAYQKLKDTVRVDLDGYVKKFKTRKNASLDVTHEEFLADFLADRATDPEFWEGVAKEDRPLFQKLVDLFRSIWKSVKAGRFGTEQFVSNMNEADAAIRDALNVMRMQDLTGAAPVKGKLKTEVAISEIRFEDKEGDIRFAELTADLDPTDIEGWKATHEAEYQELIAMRERVLRAAGYDVGPVYHGTNSPAFSEFEIDDSRARDSGFLGRAFYFTRSEGMAESFGRNVVRAMIRWNNPFDVRIADAEDAVRLVNASRTQRGLQPLDAEKEAMIRKDFSNLPSRDTDGPPPVWREKFFKEQGDTSAMAKAAGHDAVIGASEQAIAVTDPTQIKSADPLALDASGKLIPPSQWGDAGNPDIRFEEKEGDPVQTAGTRNPFRVRKPSKTVAVEKALAKRFDHATAPLDAAGQKRATRFLANLTDDNYVREMQRAAIANGLKEKDAHIVSGMARGAVVAYAARLAQTDFNAARDIIHKVYKLSSDIGFLFPEGKVDASAIGKALRSLRSYVGGSIVGLFNTLSEGTADFVTKKQGAELSKQTKGISKTDVEGNSAEDLADAITIELDPELKQLISAAEQQARDAWRRVAQLIGKIHKPKSAVKMELPEGEDLDSVFGRFEALANDDTASLGDIAAAFEQLFPLLESELGDVEKAAVRRARTTSKDATKAKEEGTGTTETSNQWDIMGKRRIGVASRAPNEVKTEQNDIKKAFDELMVSGKGRTEFIESFVALGGTEEVGAELYDANVKIVQRQQERRMDTEKKQAEATAERRAQNAEERRQAAFDKAQEFVDAVGDVKEPRRPTSATDTPRKVVARFINPRNARVPEDSFRQQLREFANSEGEQFFTEDQIDQIFLRAEIARDEAQAARSLQAQDKAEAQIERRGVAQLSKASRLFAGASSKDAAGRSVRDIILQDFINNPQRKILSQAERIELAEEVLREKTDLTDEEIPGVARMIEGQLAKKLEEAKFAAARPLLRSLGGKNLTRSQIEKAIRLEVLDPSNDFVTSIAALSGWEGLTAAESARLTTLQREIDLVGPLSRAGMTRIMEQARIIEAAPGIPPGVKDTVNAYIRGSIYSSIGSQLVGVTVGVWESHMLMAQEVAVSIVRNKGDVAKTFEELLALHKGWATNALRGLREVGRALKTGSTYREQVQGGQEGQGKLEDKIFVDPLTRTYDDANKKMAAAIRDFQMNKNKGAAKVLWQAFRKWVVASGRFTFRALGAVDSAWTKMNAGTMANILAFRRAKDLGITKAELTAAMGAAQRYAEAHRAFLVSEVGLTNSNEIAIEVQDAIEGAFYQALTEKGVEGLDTLLDEAASDFQDKIGTGETSQKTWIGRATRSVTSIIQTFPFPLAGIIPAVRTVGNVMDGLMWTAPGVGIYRALRFNNKTAAERNEFFPNIKSDWQFRRRQAMAVLTNAATLGIVALLNANEDEPDDEKWFWWTGAWPALNDAEQARWKRNDWTENTLIVGGLRFQLDRGFGQTLLVPMTVASMAYEASNGLDGKEGLAGLAALAEALVPGFAQGRDRFKSTDSVYGFKSFAEQQAASLIPFSALLKSGRRMQERVDTKNTEAAWYQLNPFYADSAAPGVVQLRNVLGEPMAEDVNAWGWLKKLGSPMFFTMDIPGRDPVKKTISDDFFKRSYAGGEVTLEAFKTRLEESNTPYSPALYVKWKQERIANFVELYSARRAKLLTEDNYASSVGSVWTKAGERADRALGIKR